MAVEASCTASPRDLKRRQITSGMFVKPGDRQSGIGMAAFILVAHIRNDEHSFQPSSLEARAGFHVIKKGTWCSLKHQD